LKQLHDIESILKGLNITSDHDTGDIIEAREQAVKLYEKLYIDGAWGALVLDYGFAFLQDQLKRSDSGSHQKFSTIVKNPDLLFIFADLMAIPMFEKVHLVNFANLYDWRRMTRVWLDVFLKYARDTYRYIAYPAKDPLASIADVMEKSSSSVSYMYGFLDSTFHDIIDEAYKNHLAKAMVAFGIKDGVQRATYILDEAWKTYPFIEKINAPLPLFCQTFIRDLAQSVFVREKPLIEVTLSLMPSVGDEIPGAKEIILDAEDQQVIASCLDILACSRVPWSYQNASNPNQHHISLALSTMQLYNDKASIYHQYLGTSYLGREVFSKTMDLLRTLGKECVNQAFSNEQNRTYDPPEHLE
ncbi:hypothetical protein BDZ97DRAFT_1592406, partial [Flammula alnicola]